MIALCVTCQRNQLEVKSLSLSLLFCFVLVSVSLSFVWCFFFFTAIHSPSDTGCFLSVIIDKLKVAFSPLSIFVRGCYSDSQTSMTFIPLRLLLLLLLLSPRKEKKGIRSSNRITKRMQINFLLLLLVLLPLLIVQRNPCIEPDSKQ